MGGKNGHTSKHHLLFTDSDATCIPVPKNVHLWAAHVHISRGVTGLKPGFTFDRCLNTDREVKRAPVVAKPQPEPLVWTVAPAVLQMSDQL